MTGVFSSDGVYMPQLVVRFPGDLLVVLATPVNILILNCTGTFTFKVSRFPQCLLNNLHYMLASPKAISPLNQEQLQQIRDNLFFGFSMFMFS